MRLHEILLPLRDNVGVWTGKARSQWEALVLRDVGGYSMLADVKGAWQDKMGKVYRDVCVPYRVACTSETWLSLVAEAHNLFPDQKCLLWYIVADSVTFSEPNT